MGLMLKSQKKSFCLFYFKTKTICTIFFSEVVINGSRLKIFIKKIYLKITHVHHEERKKL